MSKKRQDEQIIKKAKEWSFKNYLYDDVGLAHALADNLNDELLYVTGFGWHVWTGKCYEQNETLFDNKVAEIQSIIGEALNILNNTLEQYKKNNTAESTIKELEAQIKWMQSFRNTTTEKRIMDDKTGQLKKLIRTPIEATNTQWQCINYNNGTYDYEKNEFGKHNKAHLATSACNYALDFDLVERIEAGYIDEFKLYKDGLYWMQNSKEMIDYLLSVIGYCSLGDMGNQVAFINEAEGKNGKSEFARIIDHALGSYAVEAEPTLFSEQQNDNPDAPTPSLVKLYGKRFVRIEEVKANKPIDVKTFVDTDKTIQVREPYGKRQVPMPWQGKLFFTTNNQIVEYKTDEGTWRRKIMLYWPYKIPQEDRILKYAEKEYYDNEQRMKEVIAIIHCKAKQYMQKQDLAEYPKKWQAKMANYKKEQSPVEQFVDAWMVKDLDARMQASELLKHYNHFCDANNYNTKTTTTFGNDLKQLGYDYKYDDEGNITQDSPKTKINGCVHYKCRIQNHGYNNMQNTLSNTKQVNEALQNIQIYDGNDLDQEEDYGDLDCLDELLDDGGE